MDTSSQQASNATSAESRISTDRVRYAIPADVFAAMKDHSSIAIEEFPRGEISDAAREAERRIRDVDDTAVVISLTLDAVGKVPIDTLWFHPDEDARFEVIDRARAALDNAEAALLSVGYVDRAQLLGSDYRPVPKRERDAFTLGQDSMRSQSQ